MMKASYDRSGPRRGPGACRGRRETQRRLERYLLVLEASSQRMARLLNDMLLVSALEQSNFLIQPQPVELAEEMERKASIYQLQAAAHEIEFFSTYHKLAGQEAPVLLDLSPSRIIPLAAARLPFASRRARLERVAAWLKASILKPENILALSFL